VIIEFVRSNLPVMRFPWALYGNSQWKNLVFIQSADHMGAYGLSFVLAFTNISIFALLCLLTRVFKKSVSWKSALFSCAGIVAFSGGLMAANLGYGYHYLDSEKSASRYLWLPVTLTDEGYEVHWQTAWRWND